MGGANDLDGITHADHDIQQRSLGVRVGVGSMIGGEVPDKAMSGGSKGVDGKQWGDKEVRASKSSVGEGGMGRAGVSGSIPVGDHNEEGGKDPTGARSCISVVTVLQLEEKVK